MTIQVDIESVKFNTDDSNAYLQQIKLQYSNTASGAFATGSITASGTATGAGTFKIQCGGFESDEFNISIGDTIETIHLAMASAMNSAVDYIVTASASASLVDYTFDTKGSFANSFVVQVVGPSNTGISFSVVQPSGGVDETEIGRAIINALDGANSSSFMDASYLSQFETDKTFFKNKQRFQLTLPTITETCVSRDENGDVSEIQLLF